MITCIYWYVNYILLKRLNILEVVNMIKCNLAVIMAERNLNMSEVAEKTGIARNTLAALYHNTGKGIQFDTLDKLCKFFGIATGDMFTYMVFNARVFFIERQEDDEYGPVFSCGVNVFFQGKSIDTIIEAAVRFTSDNKRMTVFLNYHGADHAKLSVVPLKYLKDHVEARIVESIKKELNVSPHHVDISSSSLSKDFI